MQNVNVNEKRRAQRALPIARQREIKARRIAQRFARLRGEMRGFPSRVQDAVAEAEATANRLVSAIEKVGDDFVVEKKRRAKRGLEVGSLVDLTARGRERYGAHLDEGDLVGAEVLGTAKGVVEVRFASGRTGFLSRGFVAPRKG